MNPGSIPFRQKKAMAETMIRTGQTGLREDEIRNEPW